MCPLVWGSLYLEEQLGEFWTQFFSFSFFNVPCWILSWNTTIDLFPLKEPLLSIAHIKPCHFPVPILRTATQQTSTPSISIYPSLCLYRLSFLPWMVAQNDASLGQVRGYTVEHFSLNSPPVSEVLLSTLAPSGATETTESCGVTTVSTLGSLPKKEPNTLLM